MTGSGEDELDAHEMLRRVGKKYSAEILEATATPQSAQQLSERLDIPIATCYRRIDELSDAGLLVREDSVLTDQRRRVDVFRRNVDRITVEFGDETATISTLERSGVKNRIDDIWRSLHED